MAVALVTGKGGEQAFTDAAVADPAVVALRQKVHVVIDNAIKPDQVDMTVTLNNGRTLHQFIEHAVGSQLHPMSDEQLNVKFDGLTDGILSPARSRVLRETCWHAWELADAGDIGRAGAAG